MTTTPASEPAFAARAQPANGGGLRVESLRRVLHVARLLGALDDLRTILSVIIDAMRDALDAERATVFEYDHSTETLFSTVAHGLSPLPQMPASGEIRIPVTTGLAGECARTRQIISIPDAYADPRFNRSVDKMTGFRTRSILAIPLEGVDGELIGVAQVLNKAEALGGVFTDDDKEIAIALAAQAAVALKRARLLEDRLVRQKLENDIDLARRMQQESWPSCMPSLPGYDIAGFSKPADQTGGDAYDAVGLIHAEGRVIVAAEGEPADSSLLFIADATGHGLGPALSVTQARSMLRMGIRSGEDLFAIASNMNTQLCEDLPPGRFVTAWLAVLDTRAHTLTTFSAGQAPLLHYRVADGSIEVHCADAAPFGVLPDLGDDRPKTIHLAPGDMFVVLSDGFYEASTEEGDQFGDERVANLLRLHRGRSAEEIIAAVREAVDAFTGGLPAADDQTAVIVRRLAQR